MKFSNLSLLACHFSHDTCHFSPLVQELGLQRAYTTDEKTHGYICQLLSLPYLPCEHIGPIFERLQEKAVTQPLQELTTYIATTWLENRLWPTSSWSVFGRVICTNNDIRMAPSGGPQKFLPKNCCQTKFFRGLNYSVKLVYIFLSMWSGAYLMPQRP